MRKIRRIWYIRIFSIFVFRREVLKNIGEPFLSVDLLIWLVKLVYRLIIKNENLSHKIIRISFAYFYLNFRTSTCDIPRRDTYTNTYTNSSTPSFFLYNFFRKHNRKAQIFLNESQSNIIFCYIINVSKKPINLINNSEFLWIPRNYYYFFFYWNNKNIFLFIEIIYFI